MSATAAEKSCTYGRSSSLLPRSPAASICQATSVKRLTALASLGRWASGHVVYVVFERERDIFCADRGTHRPGEIALIEQHGH